MYTAPPQRPAASRRIAIAEAVLDRDVVGRGPAPPKGHGTHHYHSKLYALDTKLDLHAGATRRELVDAMGGHIVAQGELIGTYER